MAALVTGRVDQVQRVRETIARGNETGRTVGHKGENHRAARQAHLGVHGRHHPGVVVDDVQIGGGNAARVF